MHGELSSPEIDRKLSEACSYSVTFQEHMLERMAKGIYGEILNLRNPFGKTWDELTDHEKRECRSLALAAWEAI